MRTDLIKSVRILQLSSRGARWGRSAAYGSPPKNLVVLSLPVSLLKAQRKHCSRGMSVRVEVGPNLADGAQPKDLRKFCEKF